MTSEQNASADDSRGPILVTGARGGVGRELIAGLLAAGASVRAASADPASTTVPDGVDLVRVNLDDPATLPTTLPAALNGVRKVFLYAAPHGIDAFVDVAARAGVRQVVLLSSVSADVDEQTATSVTEQSSPIAWRHITVERALVKSGIPWTFLRPGPFAANALRWAGSIRAEGTVALPYADAELAPIHEKDMADVALRALLEDGHENAVYPLTGPESLTQRRQAELIGAAIGSPVRVVEQSHAEAREVLLRWLPFSSSAADLMLDSLRASVGHPAAVSDTVQKVTGKPGRTFAEWASDHADDFR